jgi:hypothetical protein
MIKKILQSVKLSVFYDWIRCIFLDDNQFVLMPLGLTVKGEGSVAIP